MAQKMEKHMILNGCIRTKETEKKTSAQYDVFGCICFISDS